MGIFSRLLGMDNVVEKGMDGIDKAFYTDEEKEEDRQKRIGLKIKILKAYEPFKLAQRYMMIVVGVPYMLVWSIATFVGVYIDIAIFFSLHNFTGDANQLFSITNKFLDGKVGAIFQVIAAFYFGGGLLEGSIKAVKKK